MSNPKTRGKLRLQIAFQGGGAKICALLAAAEAIQTLERQGAIEVTRVAGTSAGSIVAALLATGQDLAAIRNRLRDIGLHELQKLLPARSWLWKVQRALRGQPIADSQRLRKLLGKFFNETGFVWLRDLKKPIFITAADILTGRKIVYKNPEDDEAAIINCLVDSCALPYVFRAPANLKESAIVDGGICENLPSDELANGQDDFGKVIGISFLRKEVPEPPSSLIKFSMALLETAIHNSTDRARRLIGEGALCSIDTSVGTFDFEEALTDGLRDQYDRIRLEVKAWFENGLLAFREEEKREILLGDPWRQADPELQPFMRTLAAVYRSQFSATPLSVVHSAIVTTAYSLLDGSDPRARQPDLVQMRIQFQPPAEQSLHCYWTGLGSYDAEAKFEPFASLNVRDAFGEDLRLHVLPMEEHQLPQQAGALCAKARSVLVFFDPILTPDDRSRGPFTLV